MKIDAKKYTALKRDKLAGRGTVVECSRLVNGEEGLAYELKVQSGLSSYIAFSSNKYEPNDPIFLEDLISPKSDTRKFEDLVSLLCLYGTLMPVEINIKSENEKVISRIANWSYVLDEPSNYALAHPVLEIVSLAKKVTNARFERVGEEVILSLDDNAELQDVYDLAIRHERLEWILEHESDALHGKSMTREPFENTVNMTEMRVYAAENRREKIEIWLREKGHLKDGLQRPVNGQSFKGLAEEIMKFQNLELGVYVEVELDTIQRDVSTIFKRAYYSVN